MSAKITFNPKAPISDLALLYAYSKQHLTRNQLNLSSIQTLMVLRLYKHRENHRESWSTKRRGPDHERELPEVQGTWQSFSVWLTKASRPICSARDVCCVGRPPNHLSEVLSEICQDRSCYLRLGTSKLRSRKGVTSFSSTHTMQLATPIASVPSL